jgi:DNA-binding NtrC family response regulator
VKGISSVELEASSYIQDCLSRDWPGNVRELKNELRRLVSILNPLDAGRLLEELSRPDSDESRVDSGDFLSDKKVELEKTEIAGALRRFNNDREQAARYLGISKTTLYRKIKMYNLD